MIYLFIFFMTNQNVYYLDTLDTLFYYSLFNSSFYIFNKKIVADTLK
jgi:hypothetical protein